MGVVGMRDGRVDRREARSVVGIGILGVGLGCGGRAGGFEVLRF